MRKASEILKIVFEDIRDDIKDYNRNNIYIKISLIVFTFEGNTHDSGIWYHSDIYFTPAKKFKIIRNEIK